MVRYLNGGVALVFAAGHTFAFGPQSWTALLAWAVGWVVGGTLLSRWYNRD